MLNFILFGFKGKNQPQFVTEFCESLNIGQLVERLLLAKYNFFNLFKRSQSLKF